MDAIIYEAPGMVSFKQIPTPHVKANEALVHVRYSGICHTDIDILYGRYGNNSFPLIPGHEYAGVIEAVGDEITGLKPGDAVVIDPNRHCGTCPACLKGITNLCAHLDSYGVTRNGGFAEFSVVREANLFRLEDLSLELAALAEPMGCVLNGIDMVGCNKADSVLIFGAGPIGLLLAMALRARHVNEITLADINEERLEKAEGLGFTTKLAHAEALADRHHAMDLVIEATGVTSVAARVPSYLADAGRALLFGVCPPDAEIAISPFDVFRRQLTIVGVHSLNHNIPEALDMIRAIGPDIAGIITDKVPLNEIPTLLTEPRRGGQLKILAAM